MIKYLTHNLIDKNRWDNCISNSKNRRVYGFSWYLDVVSPGWDALVEDDYAGVFPLTHHQKWSVRYLHQPYFAQQLGIFSPEVVSNDKVAEFLGAVPQHFRFIEIHLNHLNHYEGGADRITPRVNYELDLSPGYDSIAGNYSQNARRNLRKAREAGLNPGQSRDADELISLFSENFGKTEGKLGEGHYAMLRRLFLQADIHNRGYISAARTADGRLSAGAYFLPDHSRLYFLFAASAPSARVNGAMFLLIDHAIANHAGRNLILDFEGGNDPNLGRFYAGFGAKEVVYQAVQFSRLSKAAELGLYFARKLRRQGKKS